MNLDTCPDENFKYLLQRLSQDILFIMHELNVDRTEMAILKAILLFDPGKVEIKRIYFIFFNFADLFFRRQKVKRCC